MYLTGFCPLGSECLRGHPHPALPLPEAYEPPAAPSNRDLGPPPPGYGRYADFDRNAPGGGPNASFGGGAAGLRRNIDDVVCFKVCLLHFSGLTAYVPLVRRTWSLC